MNSQKVTIPLPESKKISGILSVPNEYSGETGVILAHGAGNDMNNPLLAFVAERLAMEGYLSLRFNFPYKEEGRTAPDRPAVLYSAWEAAFRFLGDHPEHRLREIVVAGKSMGGRIATQMVAEKRLPASGIVLLGYPLHPAGKKEKLRDAHLYDITLPMLFFAGTRDQLCDLDLLDGVLSRLKAPWELVVIEGGDHSFNVARADHEQIYGRIANETIRWLKQPSA